MLTGLVLICSLASTPDLRDCSRDNAAAAMRMPATFANPTACFLHAQAYLAETAIGRDIGADERVKITCMRKELTVELPQLTGR